MDILQPSGEAATVGYGTMELFGRPQFSSTDDLTSFYFGRSQSLDMQMQPGGNSAAIMRVTYMGQFADVSYANHAYKVIFEERFQSLYIDGDQKFILSADLSALPPSLLGVQTCSSDPGPSLLLDSWMVLNADGSGSNSDPVATPEPTPGSEPTPTPSNDIAERLAQLEAEQQSLRDDLVAEQQKNTEQADKLVDVEQVATEAHTLLGQLYSMLQAWFPWMFN
jgi:hypothetical protein